MAEEKEENQVLYASVRLPQLFHKLRKRGELIKMGVQIAIFKFSNLDPSRIFSKGVAYEGSNPARLGELGGNLLPPFPINRRRETVPNIPNPHAFQLFWVKKIVSVKKIQAEVLP